MSSKISLIIQREYNQRVRKRTFILTTLLMPLLMVGLIAVPTLIAIYGGGGDQRTIMVVDQSGIMADKFGNTDILKFEKSDAPYPAVSTDHPEAFGYLIISQDIVANPSGLKLYTRASSTIDIEREIRNQVSHVIEQQRIIQSNVPALDSLIRSVEANATMQTFQIGVEADKSGGEQTAKESSSVVSMGVAYVAGLLIYMFVFIYGAMVMQGVIEEKSNRIIEVIVSSVKPFQLMMGKILGIALVALTQVLIWVAIGFIGVMVMQHMLAPDPAQVTAMGGDAAAAMAQQMPSQLSGVIGMLSDPFYVITVVGCFVIFFVGGYLLYAAMFAAIGSGVDNAADAQQLQLPVTIPLLLAIVVMISVMRDPTGSMAFWFSIIPFTSPIIMMTRVAYGVPAWELILSIAMLYGTFIFMTWFAAKIYRVGIFMYGKKPTLMEIIRWAKYKN